MKDTTKRLCMDLLLPNTIAYMHSLFSNGIISESDLNFAQKMYDKFSMSCKFWPINDNGDVVWPGYMLVLEPQNTGMVTVNMIDGPIPDDAELFVSHSGEF